MVTLHSLFSALNEGGGRYVVVGGLADADKRAAWARDKGMVVFSMRPSDGVPIVDLFIEHPIPFDELWQRSIVVTMRGLPVRVASIDDIIALKRISGRPEDLADIDALRQIQQIRQAGGA